VGGGGIEWHFVIYKFNGKKYKRRGSRTDRPDGEVLIDKDFANSFFGPLPTG
jgi:hypothetical protein